MFRMDVSGFAVRRVVDGVIVIAVGAVNVNGFGGGWRRRSVATGEENERAAQNKR